MSSCLSNDCFSIFHAIIVLKIDGVTSVVQMMTAYWVMYKLMTSCYGILFLQLKEHLLVVNQRITIPKILTCNLYTLISFQYQLYQIWHCIKGEYLKVVKKMVSEIKLGSNSQFHHLMDVTVLGTFLILFYLTFLICKLT